MKRAICFTCALLILGCGASDSRQTCVDRTEDLRLDCGVGVVYVEGAAALGDCSESVTCCQDTSHGDDVIAARVRDWCDGLARCHVTASTWYPAESGGRTSLAVKYMCKVSAHSRSGMEMSVDQLAELRVMPAIQNTTKCYDSYFYQLMCFNDTTIEITDAVYGVSPCNSDGDPRHCCPDPGDCTIPVEEDNPLEHPDYYNEILVSCNNKQTCDGLQALWIHNIYKWCPGTPGNTDYVTLHYMCLTEADRRPTTATATTVKTSGTTSSKPSPGHPVSTATATVVSTVTDVTDDDDDDDATQTTLIIVVILVVVVAVTVGGGQGIVRPRDAGKPLIRHPTGGRWRRGGRGTWGACGGFSPRGPACWRPGRTGKPRLRPGHDREQRIQLGQLWFVGRVRRHAVHPSEQAKYIAVTE